MGVGSAIRTILTQLASFRARRQSGSNSPAMVFLRRQRDTDGQLDPVLRSMRTNQFVVRYPPPDANLRTVAAFKPAELRSHSTTFATISMRAYRARCDSKIPRRCRDSKWELDARGLAGGKLATFGSYHLSAECAQCRQHYRDPDDIAIPRQKSLIDCMPDAQVSGLRACELGSIAINVLSRNRG
jgi:hypothetical protein